MPGQACPWWTAVDACSPCRTASTARRRPPATAGCSARSPRTGGAADLADLRHAAVGDPQGQRARSAPTRSGRSRSSVPPAGSWPATRGWRAGRTRPRSARPATWCWARRRGSAGSDTSKREICVPCVRPSVLASCPMPTSRPVADRLQVRGVSGDLQLAGDLRLRRVAQVDAVERVGLPERHHVPARADEPDRVDPLALAQPVHHADLGELAALLLQHPDRRALRRLVGGGHPQVAVPFGQRVLVEQPAGHLAGGGVDRLGAGRRVEAVDLGLLVALGGRPGRASSRAASAGRWRGTGWSPCRRRCRRRRPRTPGRRCRAPVPARSKVSTVTSDDAGEHRRAG